MRLILMFALLPGVAIAGGYDTPMLYTGEHLGMGGAAVANVSDASALFHNPAGLARVAGGDLLLHATYLRGTVTGSPDSIDEATSITSEPTSAPFPLLGAAYRLNKRVVLGLGAFPIASAGATYRYEGFAGPVRDSTTLVFIEAGPGLAVNLGRVNFGVGYRYTTMMLERYTGGQGVDPLVDFTLRGDHASGFRAGLQGLLYEAPGASLRAGLSYRHQVILNPTDPEARALGFDVRNVQSRFILPSRIVGGLRGDTGPWGLAADVEYGFNSQNQKSTLSAEVEGFPDPLELDNVFGWQDAWTARLGLERRIGEVYALRIGGAYDGQTSSKQYPTAFGTPPAPTVLASAGLGYRRGPWRADLALAHRRGATEVTAEDLEAAEEACVFCSKAGNYAIELTGVYMTFGYQFGGSKAAQKGKQP